MNPQKTDNSKRKIFEEIKKLILNSIERVKDYNWNIRQKTDLDKLGNFIYETFDYDELETKIDETIKRENLENVFRQYTINRWYNFATSFIIESIFAENPKVQTELNDKNRFVDFYIEGINFDLKTTFPPKRWNYEKVKNALENPLELAKWFYEEQSETRFHSEQRLFLVLVDFNDIKNNQEKERWKMKKEFEKIRKVVNLYLSLENREFPIIKFKYGHKEYQTKTDVIFLIKENEKFSYRFFEWKNNLPKIIEGKL